MNILFSVLLLGFPFAMKASAECTSDYESIADGCYRFYQEKVTWSEAKNLCEDNGDFMPDVENREQYDGILANINANYPGQYWTSGKLEFGNWIWTTGGGDVNKAWFGKVPSDADNQCIYFCSFTNKYWPRSCDAKFRYFCQHFPIVDELDQDVGAEVDLSIFERIRPSI